VNAALLSRSKVFVLQALSADAIEGSCGARLTDKSADSVARHHVTDEAIRPSPASPTATHVRRSTCWSSAAGSAPMDPETMVRQLGLEQLDQSIQRRALLYDKGGEEHYNLISALHKSMRNSDPDAAVYWVARMLEAGEDPLYIARRLIRFASEDIGNADPQALTVAVAAQGRCALHRHARRQHCARASRDLSRDCAEEQRGLHGLQRRRRRCTHEAAEPCRFTCATRRRS
jgi:putative ATPase